MIFVKQIFIYGSCLGLDWWVFCVGETASSQGTADFILKKDNLVLVCEIKYSEKDDLNDLAIDALSQIKKKKYFAPYLDYELVLLGVAFGNREIKSCIEPLTKDIG